MLAGMDAPGHHRAFCYSLAGEMFGTSYAPFTILVAGFMYPGYILVKTYAPIITDEVGNVGECRVIEVSWDDSPVYLSARWGRAQPGEVDIKNVEYARARDYTRARQAQRLLATFRNVGRPADDDVQTEMKRDIVRRAERLKRQFPSLTWDQVAARFNVAPATLKVWRRKFRE
jgi:hypothetical protein